MKKILVMGLPGSGKTTFSEKLKSYLENNSEFFTPAFENSIQRAEVKWLNADEVRNAYLTMERSVSEKFSAEDFLGVTVQPMLKLNDGYELIIGSSPDPQFGPVLLFGTGGTLVEVFKDRALGLPPLNTTLARRMMERTKIYEALKGIRGRDPVDMARLEDLMVRFSQLVADQRWVKEIDINPLFASADHLIALDARVVLYDCDVTEAELPKLAIRPYPTQHIYTCTAKNGEELTYRPIRPEDEPLLVQFHENISEKSVYLRYFRSFNLDQRTEHDRLTRICFVDYDRTIAQVVTRRDEEGNEIVVAVGRLSRAHATAEAEYALLVSDAYQGMGVGSRLLRRLLEIGREEGIETVIAYILPENTGMRHISQTLGFKFEREEDLLKATLQLKDFDADNPSEAK